MTDLRAAHRPVAVPTPDAAIADERIAQVVTRLYGFAIFANRPLTIPADLRACWLDGFRQGYAAAVKHERSR